MRSLPPHGAKSTDAPAGLRCWLMIAVATGAATASGAATPMDGRHLTDGVAAALPRGDDGMFDVRQTNRDGITEWTLPA